MKFFNTLVIDPKCKHSADVVNLNKIIFLFFTCDGVILKGCFEFQFMFTSIKVWQLWMVLYTMQCYI